MFLCLTFLLGSLVLISCSFHFSNPADRIPTITVKPGELLVTLTESGEIQAASGEQIIAPDVNGNLKIVHLWPEGEQVEIGDLILQFDQADLEKEVSDTEDELTKVQADLEKTKATQSQKITELEARIEDKKAALELARIQLQKYQLESTIQLEEARIKLQQAGLEYDQAQKDLQAQHIVHKVELDKNHLQIAQQLERLDKARRQYANLSIRATRPGIVVYEEIWKGGKMEKIRVGDQVWRKHALLSLPDLSTVQVVSQVGEGDAKRVKAGQPAFIRLEAFPGPVFHGQVTRVSPIANPHLDAFNVKVFEMLVSIEEQDEHLKPGMSAAVEVVVQTLAEVLAVPREAVFKRGGADIVYCRQGRSFKPVEVTLGPQNATLVNIVSGLEAGVKVALKDPTL